MGYFGKEGMQSNAASLLKKQNVVVNLTRECTQDISIGYPFSCYCFIHTSSLLHKKEDQEIPDMLNLLFITTTTTFKDSTIRTIEAKMAKSRLVNRRVWRNLLQNSMETGQFLLNQTNPINRFLCRWQKAFIIKMM